MKFCAAVTKGLAYICLGLAGLVMLMGVIGVWMKQGFSGVQELLNPYNMKNSIFLLIILSPGMGLLILSEKLYKAKQDSG